MNLIEKVGGIEKAREIAKQRVILILGDREIDIEPAVQVDQDFYSYSSIRKAVTEHDANTAGLFDYIPNCEVIDK